MPSPDLWPVGPSGEKQVTMNYLGEVHSPNPLEVGLPQSQ